MIHEFSLLSGFLWSAVTCHRFLSRLREIVLMARTVKIGVLDETETG
jgi:hypothetical protein